MALPGSIVGVGKLVTPGGAQGPAGGLGPTAVSADAGNIATLGSDNLILVPQSSIWSVRLRSWNSVGNPNFEVDQRNIGQGAPTANSFAQDRWFYNKTGTMTFSILGQQDASSSPILIPGTSFAISRSFFRFTVGTQQVSLAAGDKSQLYQQVEGPQLRELISDVHSIQVLARSSVAGLSFGVSLRDVANTRSLTLLATIPTANTWALIQFPNLPVWSSGATWSLNTGTQGYYLTICPATGATMMSPANNSWQNGNFIGAIGQSNFCAQPGGSTLDIAFINHEPGPLCTQCIDKPFIQNLDECQRYFGKSYYYGHKPGTVTGVNANYFLQQSAVAQNPIGQFLFKKTMATLPTVLAYNAATGAAGSIHDYSTPAERTVTAYTAVGDNGYNGLIISTFASVASNYAWHHTADTGW